MILFLLCGVILSLLVLIQRGRGGGLAGAFGGAGGSSAFGTKTADVFIKATAVLGGIFFVLAIITALLMHSGRATHVRADRHAAGQGARDARRRGWRRGRACDARAGRALRPAAPATPAPAAPAQRRPHLRPPRRRAVVRSRRLSVSLSLEGRGWPKAG